MESSNNESSAEQTKRFHGLVKNLLTANLVTFGMAVVNDVFVGHTPVGFSQVAMEGVDAVLPVPLSLAEQAEQQGKIRRGVRWRSIANTVHLGAAGLGFAEAAHFINNPPSMDARGIAISGVIGLWNLGILRKIRHHSTERAEHQKIELTMQSVAVPESPEDVLSEAHHYHALIGRNLNNLEVFAVTNIIEAAPALVSPLVQSLWENGSAVSVMAANGIISAMMVNQLYKDHKLAQGLQSR